MTLPCDYVICCKLMSQKRKTYNKIFTQTFSSIPKRFAVTGFAVISTTATFLRPRSRTAAEARCGRFGFMQSARPELALKQSKILREAVHVSVTSWVLVKPFALEKSVIFLLQTTKTLKIKGCVQ